MSDFEYVSIDCAAILWLLLRLCFLVTVFFEEASLAGDIIYILLCLNALYCGYILIPMGQRYPKNMYILRVCVELMLSLFKKLLITGNSICLQRHTEVKNFRACIVPKDVSFVVNKT